MANQFETSFIPQQPILKVEGSSSKRRETTNFALILAVILFFIALGVSVGTYFYRVQVEKRVLDAGQRLADAEKLFNIDEISTYKHIDTRLTTAKQLVDAHVIFSVVLDLLETSAAQNIGLTSFGFTQGSKDYMISLSGQAPSYAAVYFQSEAWRAMRPMVTHVEISGMNLNGQTGVVGFSAAITIDPSYLNFSRVLDAQKRAATPQVSSVLEGATTPSIVTKTSNP